MNYGRGIRVLRAMRGLSQKRLAALVDLDPSYLSLLETGRRTPSPRALEKIASTLGAPVYLLTLLSSDSADLRGIGPEQAQQLGTVLFRLMVSAEEDLDTAEP